MEEIKVDINDKNIDDFIEKLKGLGIIECKANIAQAKVDFKRNIKWAIWFLILTVFVFVFGSTSLTPFIGGIDATFSGIYFLAAFLDEKKIIKNTKTLKFLENEEELNEKLEEKQNSQNPITMNKKITKSVNKRIEENKPMIDIDNYDLLTLREMKKILEGEPSPVLENNKTLGQKTNGRKSDV